MAEAKKRVGILLRVSTEAQVTESNRRDCDIPAQRTECMRFIQKQCGWAVEKEYVEIGVSGFKNRMSDRDRINEIINDIAEKRIDILLVYMFDRLARTEDEAPAVVKRLVMMGAEVWSVREGQMKFDSHIDSLMNFITFWQAAGESKKTSERVTAVMTQMAEQGKYTGGKPPYGYMAVETGRTTKKKLPEKKLAVNEAEARVIRMVFDMAVTRGYGCHRIAGHLNNSGFRTRTGNQWQSSTIATMMANPIYKGVKAYGRTTTKGVAGAKGQWRKAEDEWIIAPYNPELEIIPEEQWAKAAGTRAENNEKKEMKPSCVSGWSKLLLTGLVYCGSCGSALTRGYTSYAWTTKDGKRHNKSAPTYKCGARAQGKVGCGGKSVYPREMVEVSVIEAAKVYIDSLDDIDITGELEKLQKDELASGLATVKDFEKKVRQSEKRIDALEEEICRIIMGESALSRETAARMMEKEAVNLRQSKAGLEEARSELESRKTGHDGSALPDQAAPIWREEFDKADRDAQRAMLSKIIGRVTVWPDRIEIKLRMNIGEFLKLAVAPL